MPAANPMFGGVQATAPMSGYPQTPSTPQPASAPTLSGNSRVIDGTPLRVATIGGLMIAGLVGLKYVGLKFNISAGI